MHSVSLVDSFFKPFFEKLFIHSIIFLFCIIVFPNISLAEMPPTADPAAAKTGIHPVAGQGEAVSVNPTRGSQLNTNASADVTPETATETTKGRNIGKKPEKKSVQTTPTTVAPALTVVPAAAVTDKSEEKTDATGKDANEKKEKTDPEKETEAEILAVKQNPMFTVKSETDVSSVETPSTINFTIVVKNTGNIPLTKIHLSDPLLDSLEGPDEDTGNSWALDVDETWTYLGTYQVTQEVIDGNGVDENNVIDGDGDIDNMVTVSFSEAAPTQSAEISVKVIQKPSFTVTKKTDKPSVASADTITYTIIIVNTGNVSLTEIDISDSLPVSLSEPPKDSPDEENPKGDSSNPGVLDVDETWTYVYHYTFTQAEIDGNSTDNRSDINGASDTNNRSDIIKTSDTENKNNENPTDKGYIKNTVTVDFAETDPPLTSSASVRILSAIAGAGVILNPAYTVKNEADATSIDEPETINYKITIENTGNVSLTQISISAPLFEDLDGPEGDGINPEVLDVNEVWTYTGSYEATQEVIDANGVDANNVIDGDGDIDTTVMVSFAETDTPQTAYAAVATDLTITGDIFEKKHRYLHGFLAATRLYTSNLYKTDTDPEGCWATTVTPGIWATFPSKMKRSIEIITQNASPGGLAVEPFNPLHFQRFQAYILYSPQLEMYHGQSHKAYQDPDLGAGVIDDDDIDQTDDKIREFTGQGSVDRLTHRVDAMLHYHSGNMLAVRAIDQYKISYDAFSERTYRTDDKYTSNMFNIAWIIQNSA